MAVRDHIGIVLDKLNGLWQRGDKDTTPLDHFSDCNNIDFTAQSTILTRPGIDISQDVLVPLSNIKRIYNYPTQLSNGLIVLTYNYDNDEGSIYHVVNEETVFGPILTIKGMTDFAFVPYAGRAYISPFSSLRNALLPPSTAVNLSTFNASGVNPGKHGYFSSFKTAIGQTTLSPIQNVTTSAALADPVNTPVITDFNGQDGLLTAGGNYKWVIVYKISTGQTLPTTPTVAYTAVDHHTPYFQTPNPIPAGVSIIGVYRSIADDFSTYYLEGNTPSVEFISGTYFGGGISDAAIISQPVAPTVNTTLQEGVHISGIPIGGQGVTEKFLWRTEANLSFPKLLSTIDNDVLTYDDTAPDSSLGADAPTQNTAYIGDLVTQKGLEGEFLYVYAGDGTPARKAAGAGMTGTMSIANGVAGHTDPGLHVFGIVSQTVSGYNAPPSLLKSFTTAAGNSVSFGAIPTSGDPNVVKRLLVATKVIEGFNGDLEGSEFFFVPDAVINNNSDTFLNNISFYDDDLLADASDLLDNYTTIPAGAVLNFYHNRLCLSATFTDISLMLVSQPGEPEAISQIDGLIVVPLDGNPITNAQEMRDVLYIFKRSKTTSYADNGDVPSSWPASVIDEALGTSVHGIATVLDSGSSSIDFLIIATYQGISQFNGRFVTPELSYKIEEFWHNLDRNAFGNIQIINAPIQKAIYLVLPTSQMLIGNYSNGLDWKNIRWSPWTFRMGINTIAIQNIDEIILGADLN